MPTYKLGNLGISGNSEIFKQTTPSTIGARWPHAIQDLPPAPSGKFLETFLPGFFSAQGTSSARAVWVSGCGFIAEAADLWDVPPQCNRGKWSLGSRSLKKGIPILVATVGWGSTPTYIDISNTRWKFSQWKFAIPTRKVGGIHGNIKHPNPF